MGQDISLKIEGAGEARAYISVPKSGRGPGLLVLQEIAGVNYHLRAVADYFAELGYLALAPNMFWRLDQNHEGDYSPESNAKSIGLHDRWDDAVGIKDLSAIVPAFRRRTECTGKVGAVGYCFGGRMAYLAGAYCGIDAAACLYPTFIERVLDVADKVTCPLSLHIPEHDPMETPEAQDKIVATFRGRKNVELFRYPGAHHAFDSDARRKVYDRWASQKANGRIIRFFDRTLGMTS